MVNKQKEVEGIDYVVCQICGKHLKWINYLHLRIHNITLGEYQLKYPNDQILTCKLRDNFTGKNNHNYGIPISNARKQHLSEINSGKNHPKFGKKDSDATRKKKSDSAKGKPKSDKQKENQRIAMTGKIATPETIIALSNGQKRRFNNPAEREKQSRPGESNPNFGNKWSLNQRIALSCKNRNISIKDFDEFTHIMANEFFTSEDREKWRKAVITRDNNICQECGNKIGVKHIHHILPYRDYPDPQFSLNPKNGITLCVKCHRKTFGKEYKYFNKYFDKANGIRQTDE